MNTTANLTIRWYSPTGTLNGSDILDHGVQIEDLTDWWEGYCAEQGDDRQWVIESDRAYLIDPDTETVVQSVTYEAPFDA